MHTSIRIPDDLVRLLQAYARREGRTLSGAIVFLLGRAMEAEAERVVRRAS